MAQLQFAASKKSSPRATERSTATVVGKPNCFIDGFRSKSFRLSCWSSHSLKDLESGADAIQCESSPSLPLRKRSEMSLLFSVRMSSPKHFSLLGWQLRSSASLVAREVTSASEVATSTALLIIQFDVLTNTDTAVPKLAAAVPKLAAAVLFRTLALGSASRAPPRSPFPLPELHS